MPRPKILRSEKLFPFCYIEKILSRKRNFNLIQRLFLIVIPSCTSDETLCDICSNPFFVVISTLHVRQIMWQNQWHTLVTPTEYCKPTFICEKGSRKHHHRQYFLLRTSPPSLWCISFRKIYILVVKIRSRELVWFQ